MAFANRVSGLKHCFVSPMMIQHETFMRAAIALAGEAMRHGDEPFGALLVVDGEVRLKARNRVVTECDPTRHAELSLVSDACRCLDSAALARATLYASTEPCVMCCGAIYGARSPGWSSAAPRRGWARCPVGVWSCRPAKCSTVDDGPSRFLVRCSKRRRLSRTGGSGPPLRVRMRVMSPRVCGCPWVIVERGR